MNSKPTFPIPTLKGLFLTVFLFYSCAGAAQNNLEGNWNTGEDNSIVEVYEQNSEVFGKLVSSDNNKAKPGTLILRNFSEADGVWKGTLYAPKRDKLLDATISPDADTLNISVKAGLVTKKVAWQRVKP